MRPSGIGGEPSRGRRDSGYEDPRPSVDGGAEDRGKSTKTPYGCVPKRASLLQLPPGPPSRVLPMLTALLPLGHPRP